MLSLCSICNNEFKDVCGHCISIQQTCVLCFTKFELEDEVIRCKECFYMGHEENFSEWLKKQGSCPACRIDYTEDNFDTIILKEGTVNELYLEKSSVYFKRKQIFQKFSFQHPYYDFQQYVLSDLLDQLQFDDSHLLVSPPGSGKTIIGLATLSHFAVNTLVLTPNLAVLGSWIDRLSMFYNEKESEIPLSQIYTRSTGDLRPITITTYQQLNTSLRELDKAPKKKAKKFQFNDPINFIDRLVNHEIGLVILDEAHRLTGKWGKDIKKFLGKLGDVKVLGLTATPPQKEDAEFLDIFTDRKTEIPLPMLVREGVLVPFRDFSVIFPSKEYLESKQKELQTNNETLGGAEELHLELIDRTLNELKYLDQHAIRGTGNDYNIRWLSANLSYITQITIEIILHELEQMNDQFRGLVLLEQENIPSKYEADVTGIGGAIGLFEDLLRVPKIDQIDPIFVTGSSLLIDRDFSDFFDKLGKKWIKMNGLDLSFSIKNPRSKKYSIINGSGRDWNTDTYTRYVTYLFEQGHTKLLVGTRFLLGEGWDSQSLNTVVDLTTFASYAFVNQVKGRALRKDPNYDLKVSNMWEIAPHPAITPISAVEFSNYCDRHTIYFGIDDQGNIRNGIDRLNQWLNKNLVLENKRTNTFTPNNLNSLTYGQFDKQLKSLTDKSSNREETYQLWKVGQKLGDLYYTIKFNIELPTVYGNLRQSGLSIAQLEHLIKFLKFSLEHLYLSYDYPQYNTELRFNRRDLSFDVKILIPVETEYSKITAVMDQLRQINATKNLGVLISNYKFERFPFFARFLQKFGVDIKARVNNTILSLPWELEVKSEMDILADSEIVDIDSYKINPLRTIEGINIIGQFVTPPGSSPFRIIHDYESFIIQVITKSKQIDAIGPEVPNMVTLNPSGFVLEQEYVDLE